MNQYSHEFKRVEKVLIDAYEIIQHHTLMIFDTPLETDPYAIMYHPPTMGTRLFRFDRVSNKDEMIFKETSVIPLGLLMAISQHAIVTNG